MTLSTQWLTMVLMISSGLFLGLVLDIYRVLKGYFGFKSWFVSLVDIVYWVVSAGLVFGLLFWSNWGDFRFYINIAILCGFFIYFYWCSKKATRFFRVLIIEIEKLVSQFIKAAYHVVWIPLVKLWKLCKKVRKHGTNFLGSVFYMILKPIQWLIAPIIKIGRAFFDKYLFWLDVRNWWPNNKKDDE